MLNQSRVAADMARVANAHKPDFIISVGDNFYECKELVCATITQRDTCCQCNTKLLGACMAA